MSIGRDGASGYVTSAISSTADVTKIPVENPFKITPANIDGMFPKRTPSSMAKQLAKVRRTLKQVTSLYRCVFDKIGPVTKLPIVYINQAMASAMPTCLSMSFLSGNSTSSMDDKSTILQRNVEETNGRTIQIMRNSLDEKSSFTETLYSFRVCRISAAFSFFLLSATLASALPGGVGGSDPNMMLITSTTNEMTPIVANIWNKGHITWNHDESDYEKI